MTHGKDAQKYMDNVRAARDAHFMSPEMQDIASDKRPEFVESHTNPVETRRMEKCWKAYQRALGSQGVWTGHLHKRKPVLPEHPQDGSPWYHPGPSCIQELQR